MPHWESNIGENPMLRALDTVFQAEVWPSCLKYSKETSVAAAKWVRAKTEEDETRQVGEEMGNMSESYRTQSSLEYGIFSEWNRAIRKFWTQKWHDLT